MQKLVILVGLSASGKSTLAKQLSENQNMKIVSSDAIRAELSHHQDQTQNEKVFRIFHKKIGQHLDNKYSVAVDATNLTIKSRKQIIQIAKRHNVEVEAIICVKEIAQCIKDDKNRKFSVGEHVIIKQVKRFQMPFHNEGINKIYTVNNVDIPTIASVENFKLKIDNFDQHNKHHNMTIGEHQNLSTKYAIDNNFEYEVIVALKSHDIGKFFTQTFDENMQAHYYGHENYSAYLVLENFVKIDVRMLLVVFLVNYHMTPNNWILPKTHEKYRKLFGDKAYNMLLQMNEADKYREGI